MTRAAILVAVAIVAAPAAVSAQAVRSVERAEPTAAAGIGDPNRKICKALGPTGTRLAKARICKTAREWSEQQYEHKHQLERIQTRPNRPDGG